jgi:hypothetical protein
MKKKYLIFIFLVFGVTSILTATEQIFLDITGGTSFYGTIGGKIGWMHYWNNEKIGLITDLSYHCYTPRPYVSEGESYDEAIFHNIGIASGVVFNNMGMNGIVRTIEYIKLKGILHIWNEKDNHEPISFFPWLDLGFNLNVYFNSKIAISAGIGAEVTWIKFPYLYLSLGMKYTI